MSLTITVAGSAITFDEDTLAISQRLDERWRCQFTILDYAGTSFYAYGMQVTVVDSTLGTLFAGFLADVKQDKTQSYPAPLIRHTCDCIDNHHLADKRTSNLLYSQPTQAGSIVVDLVTTVLSSEGVTINEVTQETTTQANWGTGTLTSVVATPNVGDGDLELSSSATVTQSFTTQASWAAGGTLTNLQANTGGDLSLIGFTRNWNNGVTTGQTLFGNGHPAGSIDSTGRYGLFCSPQNETRSRLDFAGNWQNGTIDVDMSIGSLSTFHSLVFRTTNWINGDGSYAYALQFQPQSISIWKGTNGGANNSSSIVNHTFSSPLAFGTYHIRVTMNGSAFTASVNGTQYLSHSDGTYAAAGEIALRNRNTSPTDDTMYFDNFGVMSTLSGTWTATAVSINSVTTIANSTITWDTSLSAGGTVLVQTSIDGGSTYQACTSGGVIPGLTAGASGTGKTVIVKVTLSTTTAATMPDLQTLKWSVVGAYAATGNRVSPALSLSAVGRCGSSSIAWDALVPSTCTLGMDASPDGITWTDITAQNGGPIPFVNAQQDPTVDGFDTNTSANYIAEALATDGDSFAGRTVASGWGTATSGNVWNLATGTSTTSVSSSEGRIASSSSLTLFILGSTTIIDGTLSVRATQGVAASDLVYVIGRYQSNTDYYSLEQNNGTLFLQKTVGGVTSTLNSAAFTSTAGTFFWLELDFTGTTLSGYIWNDGDAKPPTPVVTATDSTFASGKYGLAGNASSATPIEYDTFSVTRPGSTWTYDTAHSRITATGGTYGVFLSGALDWAELDIFVDMDESDAGGLVWRLNDVSDCYYLTIADNLASIGTPNRLTLNKLAGAATSVLATASITFLRGLVHRFRVTMTGGVITVYMDGDQKISYTDGSPLAAGAVGLLNNGGVTGARFYQLWIQPLGDDLTGVNLYTRQRLDSSNVNDTPQVLDLTVTAYGTTVSPGTLIPSADYRQTFIDKNLDDLAKQSNYAWYIDPAKVLHFTHRQASPSPWILSSNTMGVASDLEVDATLLVDVQNDQFRNLQTLTGVTDTGPFTDAFKGDSQSTSFTLRYPVAQGATPAITLNSVKQTVGVKGTTGSQWYYAVGDAVIAQDSSGTVLTSGDTLSVSYTGTFITTITVSNQTSITALASVSGNSGIVEAVEDVSAQGMQYAAALVYANQLLTRYCVLDLNNLPTGRILTFNTLRSGLQVGQALTAFLVEEDLFDVALLITQIDISMRTSQVAGVTGPLYTWQVTASELPVIASWAKLLASALLST